MVLLPWERSFCNPLTPCARYVVVVSLRLHVRSRLARYGLRRESFG